MSKPEQALRLLLVEEQLERAEFLISHIRNGGIAVRPERADDGDQFEQLLDSSRIDLVMADAASTVLPLASVTDIIQRRGKDIPVIAILEHLDDTAVLKALFAGAADTVIRGEPKQIQHVIRQQFHALLNRRQIRSFEADLRESERRCNNLIESSRDPIAYIHDGMHIHANESYLQMFGYGNFDDLEGMPILDLIDESQQSNFKGILKDFAKTKQCPPSIRVILHPEKAPPSEVELELSPASYDGESCLQLVARPQLTDSKLSEQLKELKDRDPNTMLFNRKYFMSQLEAMVAKVSASGTGNQAILLVEANQFEMRTRNLDMTVADQVLVEFSARLSTLTMHSGICCLYRDQTLAVICNDSRYEQTLALCEKIHAAFDNLLLEVGENAITFSVSVAGVQITEQNASVPEILNRANHLLQSMDGLGGNRFEVFDPGAGERADVELDKAWKDRLEKALADGEFILNYQPIINLSQDELTDSYELLIRLQSADGESILPEHFLPIAQRHGLSDDIDRWVVSQAISLLAEKQSRNIDTQIFVKISPESLQDNTLIDLVAKSLMANAVEGWRLILELPESQMITRLKQAQSFKSAMSALGVRICLTQFGTSVDSVKMLNHFDADLIKIDRSFIEDLDKNPEHQAKIREFVLNARNLDKSTVAEFVSDANTVSLLFSAGVDWIQGNFLSPPLTQMNFDFST